MALGDGSANAPAGSAQLPGLLTSYGANRPSWQVAGVDYHVGVPTGLTLLNPVTISMAGVSVNATTHTITVTGNNVTLSGYDFSLNGGWSVVTNGANTTILNSNFLVGSNGNAPILGAFSSSNLYVGNCTIDGNNSAAVGGLIEMRGSGTLTVDHSWLKNAGGDMIQMHNDGTPGAPAAPLGVVIEYNLIQNAGMSPGAHGDYTEFLGGPYTATIMYNTTTQQGGSTQGFMVEPDFGSNPGIVTSGEIGNNTLIGSVTYFTAVTVADIVNSFTVHDNYFDPTGAFGFAIGSSVRGGPGDGSSKTSYVHNVNMLNGSVEQDSNAPSTPPPTAPAAPTIASFSTDSGVVGDHITNDNALTLSGAAAASSTVKVFDGTTQVGTATANSSGAWSITTAALADGSHSLTATATNASGTSTASAALAVTIDTVAPNAPVEASASIVGTTQVQLTGTAEANSTLQVFDGTTQVGTATANSSGAWSLTTGALTSGSHSFTAKATDAAGNTGLASAALAVTIPSAPTAPAAPTIASFSTDSGVVGDHITNDNALTLSGAAAANSTVKLFDGTTQVGTATANSSGAWSITTAALADGSHNLTATATNASGTSTASAALAVTIDTVAPNAPVETGDSIANGTQVQLIGTAEANSTLQVYDGTTLVGTTTTNATGNWTVMTSPLSIGAHNLTATATDAAGNTSAVSLPLDPVIGTPSAQNLVTNGNFETADFTGWTLSGNAGASPYGMQTFIVTGAESGNYASGLGSVGADGAMSQNLMTTAGQQYKVDFWLANQGPGPNDFTVTWNGQTLVALTNQSAQGYTEYTFTVSGTAGTSHLEFDYRQDPSYWSLDNVSVTATGSQPLPVAPTIASFSTDSGVVGDHITNDNTLTLSGAAAANSTVKLFDGTTQVGTATANSSGAWSCMTSALADGSHSLTAMDIDSYGQTSSASSALSVTIDTQAPVAPTMAVYLPGGAAIGSTTTVNDLLLKGTAEANSTVDVFDSGHQIGAATANTSGAWSFDTGHIANGSHSFTSEAVDVAGNVGAASAAIGVTVNTPLSTVGLINLYENANYTATITGTADASSQIKLYDGTTSLGTVTAAANGTWSFTTKSAVSNTVHTYTAQELDSTGHVVASSGNAILGSTGSNTLTSTAGNDLFVGHGAQDTFVFAPNFGNDVITDFSPGGRTHDVVQFSKSVFDSFASVLAHAAQVGQDVVISADASDSVTLKNTKLSALSSQDFHFA